MKSLKDAQDSGTPVRPEHERGRLRAGTGGRGELDRAGFIKTRPADAALHSNERAGVRLATPLHRVMQARGISSGRIVASLQQRLGDEAPDTKQMLRWRNGLTEARRKNMVRVLWAIRVAAKDPSIRIEEVFDLDPDSAANWED